MATFPQSIQWYTVAMNRFVFILAVLLLHACESETQVNLGPAKSVDWGVISDPKDSNQQSAVHLFDLLNNAPLPPHSQLKWLPDQNKPHTAVLWLDKAHFELQIIAHPQVGISPRSAYAANALTVLLGSGFVSQSKSLDPVGLVKVNDQTLSPVQVHGYTRIVGVTDQDVGVVHRDDYQGQLFHSALQLGPGIIEQHKLDISERDLKREKYFRAFVGLCTDHYLLGFSTQPVHLRTIGEELVELFGRENRHCAEVVNIAGDRQAVFMMKSDNNVIYHGDISGHKVSVLGFTAK